MLPFAVFEPFVHASLCLPMACPFLALVAWYSHARQVAAVIDDEIDDLRARLHRRGVALPLERVGPCTYILTGVTSTRKLHLALLDPADVAPSGSANVPMTRVAGLSFLWVGASNFLCSSCRQ